MHDIDVLVRPRQNVRDVLQGVGVNRGVESARKPTHLGEHFGEREPQRVQFDLVFVAPVRPVLLAIHVKGEPRHSGLFQIAQQFLRQGQSVGVEDGLQTLLGDQPHDLDDLGMDERIAAGNGDSVGLAVLPENGQVVLDGVERLVPFGTVFAIAALAVQITGLGDFEPGDGVVGQVPGKPVVAIMVERERHEISNGEILRVSYLQRWNHQRRRAYLPFKRSTPSEGLTS